MAFARTSYISTREVSPNFPTRTKRLSLTPVTESLADPEVSDRQMLSRSIAADVPNSWPPAHVDPPGLDAQLTGRTFI